jgi:diguanylate cyclase (GGDEF)-like protein/PAS domain S-box-containing protein
MSEGILLLTADGRVRLANGAACDLLASRRDDLAGRPLATLVERADGEPLPALAGRRLSASEMRARRGDDSRLPVELSLCPVSLAADVAQVAVLRDISDRKRHEAALRHQALHDALTGLPNRTLLLERLDAAFASAAGGGRRVALLLLDVDHFKEVNDTLGHAIGDVLLTLVARRLSALIRASDTMARLGGDEFAVLLPDETDGARAERIGRRMTEALKDPFRLDQVVLEIGVSVGIALYPDHAGDREKLMQAADVAMYWAKRSRSSVAVYDRSADSHSIRALTLTGELRRAIAEREICLHFQPKQDLASGRIAGFEALARWVQPRHRDIPPQEFVLHAERTGLIRELTELTCETAFAAVAGWGSAGTPVAVAINLSAAILYFPQLAEVLARLAARYAMPAAALVLEITESAIMVDPERSLEIATRIAGMGFRLSIDDFGTGYSSLFYLSRLPVAELKIDRSFVGRMLDHPTDAVIVQSTIDLAHNLGLKVVAEGIETAAIRDRLAELGCDLGQGYHIGRPMPAEEVLAWLAHRQPAR